MDEATDLLGALLSVQTYEHLVVDGGWPLERYVTHMQAALRRLLTAANDGDGRQEPISSAQPV